MSRLARNLTLIDYKKIGIKYFKRSKFKDAIFVANELFDAFKCEAVDGENMLFIKSGAAKFAPIKEGEILRNVAIIIPYQYTGFENR